MNEIANILESELQPVQPSQALGHSAVQSCRLETPNTIDVQCPPSSVDNIDTVDVKVSSASDSVPCHPVRLRSSECNKAVLGSATEPCRLPSEMPVADACPVQPEPMISDMSLLTATCSATSETVSDAVSSKVVPFHSPSEAVTCTLSSHMTASSAVSKLVTSATLPPSKATTSVASVISEPKSKAVTYSVQSDAVTTSPQTVKAADLPLVSEPTDTVALRGPVIEEKYPEAVNIAANFSKKLDLGEHEVDSTRVPVSECCTKTSDVLMETSMESRVSHMRESVVTVVGQDSAEFSDCLASSGVKLEQPVTAISSTVDKDAGDGRALVSETVGDPVLPVLMKPEAMQCRSVTDAAENNCTVRRSHGTKLDQLPPVPHNGDESTVITVISRSPCSSVPSIRTTVSDSMTAASRVTLVTADAAVHKSSSVTSSSHTAVTPVTSVLAPVSSRSVNCRLSGNVTSLFGSQTSVSGSGILISSTVTRMSSTATSVPTAMSSVSPVLNIVANMTSVSNAVVSLLKVVTIVTSAPNAITSFTSTQPITTSRVHNTASDWPVSPISSSVMSLLNTVTSVSIVSASESPVTVATAAASDVALVSTDCCKPAPHKSTITVKSSVDSDTIPFPPSHHVISSPCRAAAVHGLMTSSLNDSMSEDELQIVLPDDSFAACEPAPGSRHHTLSTENSPTEHATSSSSVLLVCDNVAESVRGSLSVEDSSVLASPTKKSSLPDLLLVDIQSVADRLTVADTDSFSADLSPSVADILTEMSLSRPLSPVPNCQPPHCAACKNADAAVTGTQVLTLRRRTITKRRLSDDEDSDSTPAKASASSDRVRTFAC